MDTGSTVIGWDAQGNPIHAAPQIDLSNHLGQGVYQMTDPTGKVVPVPYGQVQQATHSGYGFAGDADRFRYAKDNAADPTHTGGATYGSSYYPVAAEQTPEGHRAAVYAREDAANPLAQLAIGVGKAGGVIAKPVGDLASVIGEAAGQPENPDNTDYTSARGGLQTAGKFGTLAAMAAPAAIEAPVAAAVTLGTGAVGNMVGKAVGQHLGLTDKQSDLLGDLLAIAGGIGGAKGGAALQPKVSSLLGGSEGAEAGAEADSLTPEETKIQAAVKKSGLPEGQVAPQPETIQTNLQQSIRQVAAQAAKDAGVDYAEPPTIRDSVGTVARGVVKGAQADFNALDEATGGRWQRFGDQIKNIQNKMDEVNGIDDTAYSNLEYKRNEIETLQAQMVEDIKAAGKIDPAIADRATAQYRKGMALQDVNNAIKAATKRVPLNGAVVESVDPNSLSLRLAKLNDTPPSGGNSRLVQALGKDGAQRIINRVDNAQLASVQKATGQQALAELLRRNVVNNKLQDIKQGLGFAPKISHLKSYIEFNRMSPDEQAYFGDVPKAQAYLKGGARNDVINMLKLGAGLTTIAHLTGLDRRFLHVLIE